MAAPKTVKTYDLDGSLKDFEIPFEYLARKFVVVTLLGQDRKELVLNVDYRFTQRTVITTTQAWGPGTGYERIEIKRVTSATERLVDFSDGSILRASDLNTATVQALHIAEEGRDIATDTIGVDNDGNLDARGRKVVNLADGVEPGDAVTVRQQLANSESAMASAVAAVNAKNAAETARNQSVAAATTSGEKAVLSATEAEKARVQAVIATDAVASIGTSVGDAAASASAANDSKLAAKVSEDNSKTSETNSKASELAAEAAEVTSRSAGVQLGMTLTGNRAQPFQGFALDDGQELDKSLYPDFVAALTSGLFPTVTEAVWQADPTKRACFVLTSSTGKFRMRDLNGVQAGTEAFPTHATGAWMTRLFGVITPLGSAEAASLATAYASLASRVGSLEAVKAKRWRSTNLSLSKTVATYTHGLGVVPDLITAFFTTTVPIGAIPVGTVYRRTMGFSDWAGASGSIGMELYDATAANFKAVIALNDMIVTNPAGASTLLTMSQCTVQVELLAW